MKIKKRILSCFLSLCMIFTISAGLGATKASALSSNGSTLYLDNYNDFLAFAKMVNDGESFNGKTVKLSSDIQLENDYLMIGEYGFFSNKYFSGTFDGQGHTITGNITSSDNFVGLFGCIENATLKDFTYIGDVTGNNKTKYQDNATGGICAYMYGGSNRIENVTHSGSVTGYAKDYEAIGGIVGYSEHDNESYIINCKQTGNGSKIIALGDVAAGGILGGNAVSVVNCTNDSDVQAKYLSYGICKVREKQIIQGCINNGTIKSEEKATGIAISNGYGSSRILDCKNTGYIEGKMVVAGIYISKTQPFNIQRCVNEGEVNLINSTDAIAVGGIVANCDIFIQQQGKTNTDIEINKCVNKGKVTGNLTAGGILGFRGGFLNVKISNCINLGEITTNNTSYADVNGDNTSYADAIINAYYVDGTVENCYNFGSIISNKHAGFAKAIKSYSKMKINNCYDINTTTVEGVTKKTAAQFNSGEVCWLLNGSNNDNPAIFYQTLTKDGYPTLDSEGIVVCESSTYKNKNAGYIFSSPENGKSEITVDEETITTETQAVITGKTVKIKAQPNQGYKIKEWQQPALTDRSTVSVNLTVSEDKSEVTFIMPDADVNIVPIFDFDKYNVAFKVLGSAWEISSQDVLHNNELTVPDVEAKMKEYGIDVTFNRWVYNNETITAEQIKAATDFRQDTVIYADINATNITVNFYDENDNALTDDKYKTQTAKLISEITIPDPPEKSGYKKGWRIGSTTGEFLTISNLNTLKGPVELYADYSNEFKVTFAIKGSDFEPPLAKDFVIDSQIVHYNREVNFPVSDEINSLLYDEYNIFADTESWKTDDIEFVYGSSHEFNKEDFNLNARQLTKDAVIYANINFHKIDVSFYDEYAKELYPSQIAVMPDQIVLPEVPDKYKGYIKGWTEDAWSENKVYVTDENKETILVSTIWDDVKQYDLYATYEKPEITKANEFEYTPDKTKAYADAKGFTANISPTDGQAISKINWWLSKDNETDYTYLLTQSETTISGEGECLVGLIVYDIPKSITNLTAGVSVE